MWFLSLRKPLADSPGKLYKCPRHTSRIRTSCDNETRACPAHVPHFTPQELFMCMGFNRASFLIIVFLGCGIFLAIIAE